VDSYLARKPPENDVPVGTYKARTWTITVAKDQIEFASATGNNKSVVIKPRAAEFTYKGEVFVPPVLPPSKLLIDIASKLDANDSTDANRAYKLYDIECVAGRTYVIDLRKPAGSMLRLPLVKLLNPKGTQVALDANPTSLRIIHAAKDTGRYQIRVTTSGANDHGTYTLKVVERD